MKKITDIEYISRDLGFFHQERHKLDLYIPEKEKIATLIFIHGGSWSGGSKDLYQHLGEFLANFGLAVAVIGYRLAPDYLIPDIASDCSSAIKWVANNRKKYNLPEPFFIMGHSAGGHLSALCSLSPHYSQDYRELIKGVILIDAFGLNINDFLTGPKEEWNLLLPLVFTSQQKIWKESTPGEYLVNNHIPFFIAVTNATYPFIMLDNKKFIRKLQQNGVKYQYELVKGRTHHEMIADYDTPGNDLPEKVFQFIKENVNK